MTYKEIEGVDEKGQPIVVEYKNQCEYEIELWLSDNELDCSEDDAIEHIMSVRKKLINELDYNKSVIGKWT